MLKHALIALVAAMAIGGGPAAAEYPERPVTLMVGFPPGGNVDIAARQAQPFIEKYLGGSVAVVNKPGAGGAIAYTEAANAKPDGYTLVMLSFPGNWTQLFGTEPRYSVDSYDYIGLLTDEPFSIFVHSSSSFKSLKDMVEAAKSDPGSVTLAGAGSGSSPHLGTLLFQKTAGASFTWVPMQGSANMRSAVLGQHVVGGVTTVSVSVPMQTEGQARVLGLMAAERWDEAPDTLTFAEQGYPVEWSASRGVAGPAGLPADVKAKLVNAVKKTFDDPEFQALAKRDKQIIRYLGPDAFKTYAQKQYDMLAKMWKDDPWR